MMQERAPEREQPLVGDSGTTPWAFARERLANPEPRIFPMVPWKAFGLPGTHGMDRFDQEDLPRPTRWEFDAD